MRISAIFPDGRSILKEFRLRFSSFIDTFSPPLPSWIPRVTVEPDPHLCSATGSLVPMIDDGPAGQIGDLLAGPSIVGRHRPPCAQTGGPAIRISNVESLLTRSHSEWPSSVFSEELCPFGDLAVAAVPRNDTMRLGTGPPPARPARFCASGTQALIPFTFLRAVCRSIRFFFQPTRTSPIRHNVEPAGMVPGPWAHASNRQVPVAGIGSLLARTASLLRSMLIVGSIAGPDPDGRRRFPIAALFLQLCFANR